MTHIYHACTHLFYSPSQRQICLLETGQEGSFGIDEVVGIHRERVMLLHANQAHQGTTALRLWCAQMGQHGVNICGEIHHGLGCNLDHGTDGIGHAVLFLLGDITHHHELVFVTVARQQFGRNDRLFLFLLHALAHFFQR